ncbi:MAG TPA: D-2-hydroxyacid dehydrogenase [Methylomirabilota bacterium]|nr:D-2-hydroxyacid dehydrogenase [Methylomirabilota bacterium]
MRPTATSRDLPAAAGTVYTRPVPTATMASPVLLWCNDPGPYREAIARAGLADRVELHAARVTEEPPAALLPRLEILLAWRAAPGLLARMPRLRWIQSLTAGVEGWLALPDLGPDITLTCARGTHRIQMTENILGALFHLTKPYTVAAFDQRERRWTRRISDTLAGKTLGILGLGAIGREVALKAAALEISVIGTRQTPAPVPSVARVYPSEQTDEVLAAADFVLLLLPSTPATRGFMNARRLKAMKPTAFLLNFGRGELVVDADLIEAVKSRTIAGAVLDVFTTEPLPAEHPFWVTEGITVLPHIGGLHPERDHIVARLFTDNLARFLQGQPLRETVDRRRGY